MPRGKARPVQVRCGLTTIEYDALTAHCRTIGVQVGAFLRETAFEKIALERRPPACAGGQSEFTEETPKEGSDAAVAEPPPRFSHAGPPRATEKAEA